MLKTMTECNHQVTWDAGGHWKVQWDCGVSVVGVSDYDLACVRRLSHHCPITRENADA